MKTGKIIERYLPYASNPNRLKNSGSQRAVTFGILSNIMNYKLNNLLDRGVKNYTNLTLILLIFSHIGRS